MDDIDHEGHRQLIEMDMGSLDEQDVLPSTGVIPDQERFLPIANISRIMKKMIPPSGKVAKEAKECVQECVSEFISFLTSEASDACKMEKRKTISADDLLDALLKLGFDDYVEPMKMFMKRYREAHKINLPSRFQHATTTVHIPNMEPSGSIVSTACSTSQVVELIPNATTINKPSTSNVITEAQNVYSVSEMPSSSSAPQTIQIIAPSDLLGSSNIDGQAFAVEQPMQFYVDAVSKQHYFAVDDGNGSTQLYPVQLSQEGQFLILTDAEEIPPDLHPKADGVVFSNDLPACEQQQQQQEHHQQEQQQQHTHYSSNVFEVGPERTQKRRSDRSVPYNSRSNR